MEKVDGGASELGRRLAETARLLEALDLFDMNGHVSARAARGCWIHSAPVPRHEVRSDDIIRVNDAGVVEAGQGEAPNEVWLHLEIYRARPDVQAIVHFHGHWTNILTVAGIDPRPVSSVTCGLGAMPMYRDPDSINNLERGRSVAAALGNARVLLLRAHGAVVVGTTLHEVVVAAKYLELNSERQVAAHGLNPDAGLTPEEVERIGRALWVEKNIEKAWHYYSSKAIRDGRFVPVD